MYSKYQLKFRRTLTGSAPSEDKRRNVKDDNSLPQDDLSRFLKPTISFDYVVNMVLDRA